MSNRIEKYLDEHPAIQSFGIWGGIIVIIVTLIIVTVFSEEVSRCWNNIVHPQSDVTLYATQTPAPSPSPTIFHLSPNIKINPPYPESNEMVAISIEAGMDAKEYEVYINFANKDGKFSKYYGSHLRCKTEYINGRWVLYEKFTASNYFRVEIDDLGGDTIYRSEVLNINISKNDVTPYDLTTEDIAEGTTYIDNVTGLSFCAYSIYDGFAFISLTFPNGEQKRGSFHPGDTWDFNNKGTSYRVTFFEIYPIEKTYKINIRSLFE